MRERSEKHFERRQRDLVSVRALAELLRQIVGEPGKYLADATLLSALRSQGALAKRAFPDLGISAMSLNHQRRLADEVLGSFGALDDLRRSARDAIVHAIARVKRGNVRTKDGLLARVRELEADNQLLRQDLFVLQRAYDLRCQQARRYATAAGKSTLAMSEKEHAEIEATFSLRKKPIRTDNIVDLNQERSRAHPRR